jgi:hypothetical protein
MVNPVSGVRSALGNLGNFSAKSITCRITVVIAGLPTVNRQPCSRHASRVGHPQRHREVDAGRSSQAQRHPSATAAQHRIRTLRANRRRIPAADESTALAWARLGTPRTSTAAGSRIGERCAACSANFRYSENRRGGGIGERCPPNRAHGSFGARAGYNSEGGSRQAQGQCVDRHTHISGPARHSEVRESQPSRWQAGLRYDPHTGIRLRAGIPGAEQVKP